MKLKKFYLYPLVLIPFLSSCFKSPIFYTNFIIGTMDIFAIEHPNYSSKRNEDYLINVFFANRYYMYRDDGSPTVCTGTMDSPGKKI